MTHSPHKIVSSLEAITDSIDNDGQVYRWFAFLVREPKIKSALTAEAPGKELYAKLATAGAGQVVMFAAFSAVVAAAISFHKYLYLLAGLFLLYPLVRLGYAKRRCVKDLTRQLLKKDFGASELGQKTLYQISEIYRRRYDIPSFVDAVYFADAITRKSMLIAAFCVPFLIQSNLWQGVLILLGAYFLPYLVATHPLVYRRLK